jgi:hypothetical protein
MRASFLASGLSFLLLATGGCGVDPTTAAGAAAGLKTRSGDRVGPASRKAGGEQQERTGTRIDGVDGESQDKDHKDWSSVGSVKLDGIDGESQDKDHKGSTSVGSVKQGGVDGEHKDEQHGNGPSVNTVQP